MQVKKKLYENYQFIKKIKNSINFCFTLARQFGFVIYVCRSGQCRKLKKISFQSLKKHMHSIPKKTFKFV